MSEKPLDLSQVVTVVSGLPRSGTSMMMKMLDAGGIHPMWDKERKSDEDNPLGYYEYERVKAMPKGDVGWVRDARGKAVKVISALLQHLPPEHTYRVIFMLRAMPEILASQKKMLVRRGEPTDKVTDEELAGLYEKHVAKVRNWLALQKNMMVLYVSYNDMVRNAPTHVTQVNAFLGNGLDLGRMMEAVDPSLYRNRG